MNVCVIIDSGDILFSWTCGWDLFIHLFIHSSLLQYQNYYNNKQKQIDIEDINKRPKRPKVMMPQNKSYLQMPQIYKNTLKKLTQKHTQECPEKNYS